MNADPGSVTLRTDTITITVLDPAATLATFIENLAIVTITSGEKAEWNLPVVFDGGTELETINVEFETEYAAHFTFDEDSLVFSYDGVAFEGLEGQLTNLFGITLVNSAGENRFIQSIIITVPIEVPGAAPLNDIVLEPAETVVIVTGEVVELPKPADCGIGEKEACRVEVVAQTDTCIDEDGS